MIVSIVRSGMSFPEWEIDTPTLPRPGDHIQLWSHDDDIKTKNFEVNSVMFAGQQKRKRGGHNFEAKVGVLIHVRET